jgi:hypothetical protein
MYTEAKFMNIGESKQAAPGSVEHRGPLRMGGMLEYLLNLLRTNPGRR